MSLYPLRTWLTLSPPATRNHRKVQGLRNETFNGLIIPYCLCRFTEMCKIAMDCFMENSLTSNFKKAENLFYSWLYCVKLNGWGIGCFCLQSVYAELLMDF